jgi:hypothetical protein
MPLPPPDFHPINNCDWAEHSEVPPHFVHPVKYTGKRGVGVRYENRVREWISKQFAGRCFPSQWIRYRADGDSRIRWCQPDNLILSPVESKLTIVEVKYQHCDLAWWQLFRLYKPVVERLFLGHGYTLCTVEVVHWFDPSVRTMQTPKLRARVEDAQPGEFAVHIRSPG